MSPMNNRRMTPMAEPGILDFAPGAAAAYSLRNLSLSYSSPVVTVRRSTDNAEADFTASEVSDGTLAGWAGADGFVKQWWDQSGNARHATQATATAQPQIVDSGVLVTEGGKAAVRFDGVDDFLVFSPISSLHPWTIVEIKRRPTAGTNGPMFASKDTPTVYSHWQFTDDRVYNSSRDGGYVDFGLASNDQIMAFVVNPTPDKANIRLYRNSVQLSGTLFSGSSTTSNFDQIGRVGLLQFGNGVYQEIAMWPTDQTALRTRIEGNINRHFGVF